MRSYWLEFARNYLAIIVFLILAFYYRPFIPVFETPDEPSHFSVIKYIADSSQIPEFPNQFREGPVPIIEPGQPEYYAPPLYYMITSFFVADQDTDAFFDQLHPNPDFDRHRGINFADNYSSKNMYIHTAVNQPEAAWVNTFERIRLFSIFLSATAVFAAVLIGKELWPEGKWYLVPALLLAFNSSFLYISNGISNDPLLIALCSWLTYLAIVLLKKELNPVDLRFVIFTILISFALLTKQTAVIFIPVVLLVIREQKSWTISQKWQSIIMSGLIIGLLGGSWYWFNIIETGDLAALSTHRLLPEMALSQSVQFFVQQLWGTFKSYWASYGWATIFVENGWYLFFASFSVVGLLGWFLPTNQSWAKESKNLLWGLILLNGLLMAFWLWRTAAPYGRLLYPTIIPFFCILVEGWRRVYERLPSHWMQNGLVGLIALPILLLALSAPTRYISPAFASPLISNPSSVAFQPTKMQFGESIELAGYSLPDRNHKVGDSIHLTLYWKTSEQIEGNQLLNIQTSLLNIEETVSTIEPWLGSARYPTSVWQPGSLVRQELVIQVDETAVAPALYWFNLSVRDPQNNKPLSVIVDGISQDNRISRIGPIRIQPSNTRIDPPANEVAYIFSDEIQLNGFELDWGNDQSELEVELHWESLASMDSAYTVFVHLIDSNQQIVAQSDKKPRDGNYPTHWWIPGDVIIDTHHLQLPNNEILDGLTLLIGMYDANGRLSIRDELGNEIPQGAIPIPLTP